MVYQKCTTFPINSFYKYIDVGIELDGNHTQSK